MAGTKLSSGYGTKGCVQPAPGISLVPTLASSPTWRSTSSSLISSPIRSRSERALESHGPDSVLTGGEPLLELDSLRSSSISTDNSFRRRFRLPPSGLLLDVCEWSLAACDRTAFRLSTDFESSGPLVLMKTSSEAIGGRIGDHFGICQRTWQFWNGEEARPS